jgi:hypothetical protein
MMEPRRSGAPAGLEKRPCAIEISDKLIHGRVLVYPPHVREGFDMFLKLRKGSPFRIRIVKIPGVSPDDLSARFWHERLPKCPCRAYYR